MRFRRNPSELVNRSVDAKAESPVTLNEPSRNGVLRCKYVPERLARVVRSIEVLPLSCLESSSAIIQPFPFVHVCCCCCCCLWHAAGNCWSIVVRLLFNRTNVKIPWLVRRNAARGAGEGRARCSSGPAAGSRCPSTHPSCSSRQLHAYPHRTSRRSAGRFARHLEPTNGPAGALWRRACALIGHVIIMH